MERLYYQFGLPTDPCVWDTEYPWISHVDYALSKRLIILAQLIPEVYTVSNVSWVDVCTMWISRNIPRMELIKELIHLFGKNLNWVRFFFVRCPFILQHKDNSGISNRMMTLLLIMYIVFSFRVMVMSGILLPGLYSERL